MSGARDVRAWTEALLDEFRNEIDSPAVHVSLERIGAKAVEGSFLDVSLAFDEEVARAGDPDVERTLAALRVRFEDGVADVVFGDIEARLARDPEEGWQAWLSTLAEGVAGIRIGWVVRLTSRELPFEGDAAARATALTEAVRSMRDSRWPEALTQITWLAELPFLPAPVRAKLLVILGEISLYFLGSAEDAKACFDRAATLCEADGRVLSALGDYWLGENELGRAEACFREAIAAAPSVPFGYSGMGDVCERRGEWSAAEEWFGKASTHAPGDTTGLERLIKLFGRPEASPEQHALVERLAAKVVAIDPERSYDVLVQLGELHRQNRRFDEAHRFFARARAAGPRRTRDQVASGGACEDEERYDDAARWYERAVETAPGSYEGYLAITALYERRQELDLALDWYRSFPTQSRELTRLARTKIGELLRSMHRYDDAERELIDALRADPGNAFAKVALNSLADHSYQQAGARERALRIYESLVGILGDPYRAEYHNRLGNLYFYVSEYEDAVEHYSRAVELSGDQPTYLRNLAGAFKQQGRYEEAAAQIEAAFRLDRNEKVRKQELALVHNTRGNDLYTAGDYDGAVQAYRVAIGIDDQQAVIHSNLAGALERVGAPGGKAAAFQQAADALDRASALAGSDEHKRRAERLRRRSRMTERYGEWVLGLLPVSTPIVVEVASDLIPHTESQDSSGGLSPALMLSVEEMRARIDERFGVKVPGVRFRGNEGDLPPGMYVIMLSEIPVVSGQVSLDQRFFDGPRQRLDDVGIGSEPARHPRTGSDGHWVARADWDDAARHGIELWQPIEYLIHHLEGVLQANLPELFGHQEVMTLLETHLPSAARDVAASAGALSAFTLLCRGLLAELTPLRPIALVYGTFADLRSRGVTLVAIVEALRSRPFLRPVLHGNREPYALLRAGPELEALIDASIHDRGSHPVLAMDPESCQQALSAIRSTVGGRERLALCVEAAQVRPFARLLVELEFPDLPVLSRAEVEPGEREEAGDVETWGWEGSGTAARSRGAAHALVAPPSGGSTPAVALDSVGDVTVAVNSRFLAAATRDEEQPIGPLFEMMRDGLFYELGITVPDVRIAINDTLAAHEFEVQLNGSRTRSSGLRFDEFLVNDTPDRLKLLGIEAKPAVNPANGNACAIVRGAADRKRCEEVGLTTWSVAGFVVLELSARIRKGASALQTHAVTEFMLDSLAQAFPALVDAALARFTVAEVRGVLAELLAEEISVRDLRAILEALLTVTATTLVDAQRDIVFFSHVESPCPVLSPGASLTTVDYAAMVRTALRRHVSHKYTRGASTLVVYLVDAEIEARVAISGLAPLTPEETARLLAGVRSEVDDLPATAQIPVILTSYHVRRPLRTLIASDFPQIAVVSYQELSPDMNIQPIARITWGPGDAADSPVQEAAASGAPAV